MPTPWLSPRDLIQQSNIRLFCLPHAGSGAAAYYRWKRLLAPQIAVCPILLPGREMRLAEPSISNPIQLTEALLEATRPHLQTPYAIFGHSMGALLACAWAQRIQQAALPPPTCLFLSGRKAAHLPSAHRNLHLLPDHDFIAELRHLYGTSPGSESLLNDPELSEVFLPILRADLTLVETHRHTPSAPLTCPIVALAGVEDPSVSNQELAAWAHLTTGPFTSHRLPGDHFYHTGEGQTALIALLTAHLGDPSQP